jgi:agmatine/peptidylarginine deiminase
VKKIAWILLFTTGLPLFCRVPVAHSTDRSYRFGSEGQRQFPATDRITPPPDGSIWLDAEYDSCEGVFVRYPFGFGANLFADMVDALQDVAVVYIVTSSQTNKTNCLNYLASHGVPNENIEFIIAPTNSVWIKDYGPWFVRQEDSTLGIIDMPYAWNPSWVNDDHFPEFLEPYWGMDYYGPNIWHDGGNMMTDGHGTMMMSTYVNESNPGMTNTQINQIYHDYFGQDTCYIFQAISIDLTGHIDLWAKIMNDTTILVAQMQPNDPNYALVEGHAARMAAIPTVYGTPFHIVRCPMPPVTGYYKSYLNSTLLNHRAFVPIYNLTYDAAALDSYRVALGPDWEVIGIDCNSIAFAGGAIHCTTQNVPNHEWDFLVNASLSLEPLNPPIIIPASGGQFRFMLEVSNLDTIPISFDFWIDMTYPNGSSHGPAFLRERLNLSAGGAINRQLAQSVPGGAPAGTYYYNAYVGSYLPRVISQQDSFAFTKLGGQGDGETMDSAEEWADSGDPFTVEPCGQIQNIPQSYALHSAHPNPFNPRTTIGFALPEAGQVKLEFFDLQGRLVQTLQNGFLAAGEHEASWDASGLPSGLYLCRLQAGDFQAINKMMLLK